MLTIDGSAGEGGGQILRTSLALSLVTTTPIRIDRIRARRKRPGLLAQHLVAVRAAAAVGGAEASGAEPGSATLTFVPGALRPGSYRFAIGSAGSATLVLQTVLVPLLLAPGPSDVVVEGGTHNPMAPPFDFLARAFLPLLGRIGARAGVTLERHGFYPAGGGRLRLEVEPAARLGRLDLVERGEVRERRARALVARLPRHVAERELRVVADRLGWPAEALEVVEVRDSAGPGNVLLLEVECREATELVTGFGERGVRAEAVAEAAVSELGRWLEAGVPVGGHLADQLLLPLALGQGGTFRTLAPTQHFRSNAEVIGRFLPVAVVVTEEEGGTVRVEVGRRG
jgi:RNA 3'-terminal phosphate cyclase (ATP)